MAGEVRPHITHFDDCGCLSARKDAEIERLTTALQALDQQVTLLRLREEQLERLICEHETEICGGCINGPRSADCRECIVASCTALEGDDRR